MVQRLAQLEIVGRAELGQQALTRVEALLLFQALARRFAFLLALAFAGALFFAQFARRGVAAAGADVGLARAQGGEHITGGGFV